MRWTRAEQTTHHLASGSISLKRPLRAQTVVPAVVQSSSGPLLAKLYPANDESSPLASNTRWTLSPVWSRILIPHHFPSTIDGWLVD